MTPQKKSLLIFFSILSVIFLIVIKLIWFNAVLVGEKTHDFGFVVVTPPNTALTHTFVLKNESGRDLILLDVVPDCGCTTTETFQDVILAGEELVLSVELKLRQSQLRKSTLRLLFEDGSVEFLVLKAEGRVDHPLRISSNPVYVKSTGVIARAIIETEQFDGERPPLPVFTTPESVVLESAEWKLKSKMKPRSRIPAIWSMELSISTDQTISSQSTLKIVVGKEELIVELEAFTASEDEGESIRFMPAEKFTRTLPKR